MLLRMAQSSKAVLWSLLALSIYHRGGDLVYADKLKESALQALIGTVGPTMDLYAAVLHIAAGLILCIVEASD